jgi:hypothetical protein
MNGSGTTMLLDNLGRHPDLYAFPKETRLIPYLAGKQAQFGDLEQDSNFLALWKLVLSQSIFEQVNGDSKLPLPSDWQHYPRDLASVLDAVFRYFSAKEGKVRWCEKTPQNAQHLELLAKLYPDARFIHVIRDGRDCAVSFNRRWSRSPVLTMYRWKKLLSESRRQSRNLEPDQYMELRYEDLTESPEKWLGRICGFLDIPFDAAILESSQPYMNVAGQVSATETGSGLRHNAGKWKTYFGPKMQHRLDLIGGRALHLFGYETENPESDCDPSLAERRFLTVKDVIAQYSREIRLKLQGKIARPWRVILAKPFVAYKHRAKNRF